MLAGGHRKAASGLQHAAANVEGSHQILALSDVEVNTYEPLWRIPGRRTFALATA